MPIILQSKAKIMCVSEFSGTEGARLFTPRALDISALLVLGMEAIAYGSTRSSVLYGLSDGGM